MSVYNLHCVVHKGLEIVARNKHSHSHANFEIRSRETFSRQKCQVVSHFLKHQIQSLYASKVSSVA